MKEHKEGEVDFIGTDPCRHMIWVYLLWSYHRKRRDFHLEVIILNFYKPAGYAGLFFSLKSLFLSAVEITSSSFDALVSEMGAAFVLKSPAKEWDWDGDW